MTRLLGIPDGEVDRLAAELRAGQRPALPGAVRASIGLGTTADDIDRLVDALREIAATGSRSRYRHMAGLDEYIPEPGGEAEPASAPVWPGSTATGLGSRPDTELGVDLDYPSRGPCCASLPQ